MILATKQENLYTRVLCLQSETLIDKVWGDCSVKEGEWYTALVDKSRSDLVTDNLILLRIKDRLCPYERSMFKTESQIRDEKIESIIKGDNEEYCYYSDLPSPMAYMKNENKK